MGDPPYRESSRTGQPTRLSLHEPNGVQTVQRSRGFAMRIAVYNSAIPDVIPNTVNRALRPALRIRVISPLCFLLFALAMAHAVDWSAPEQQLARKILAVTGPGAVALTVDNRSSLTKRENE